MCRDTYRASCIYVYHVRSPLMCARLPGRLNEAPGTQSRLHFFARETSLRSEIILRIPFSIMWTIFSRHSIFPLLKTLVEIGDFNIVYVTLVPSSNYIYSHETAKNTLKGSYNECKLKRAIVQNDLVTGDITGSAMSY